MLMKVFILLSTQFFTEFTEGSIVVSVVYCIDAMT